MDGRRGNRRQIRHQAGSVGVMGTRREGGGGCEVRSRGLEPEVEEGRDAVGAGGPGWPKQCRADRGSQNQPALTGSAPHAHTEPRPKQ